MKRVKNIVHENRKKTVGRPRSVSDNGEAKAIGVRFRPAIYAHIERLAKASGKRNSDIIRELVEEALAGRAIDGTKAAKRKK